MSSATHAASALPAPVPLDETLATVEARARRPRPPSLLGYPATYLLIGINVAVYALMSRYGPLPTLLREHAWSGILTTPFDPNVLLYFGGSAPDLILFHGQWWRVISSMFVHVTLLHLLLNMWCLWNLGLFGEPLLGRPGLVAVYLLTGIAGMLQSLAVSVLTGQYGSIVAGASGAVFGIAGILIVLLSNRRLALPWSELRSLRQQVIFFALANLVLGMAPQVFPAFSPAHLRMFHLDPNALPHVDNGAHVGGFLCGLALGLPLFPRLTSARSSYRARQVLVFAVAGLVLVLFSYGIASFARALGA